MSVLVYAALGVALGFLYRWAFSVSRAYKKLVEGNAPRRNGFTLLSKIASILIAAATLISGMVLIGADRQHSWVKLVIFLAAWVFIAVATKHFTPRLGK